MRKELIRGIATLCGIVLTAKLGRIEYNGHIETYYNLPMGKVIERSDEAVGMTDLYNVREDGVKCYGPFVIVAADLSRHERYSLVDTSLGRGIVLDAHEADDPELIDIAVEW